MKKTDFKLKEDCETELRWEPSVNDVHVGVSVDQGVVTLTGTVDTYAEKWAAEKAIRRVSGVRAIAEELTVKVAGAHARTDAEIAAAALAALNWDVYVPATVSVEVAAGYLTLRGQVDWHYQREAAERAVRNLAGVKHVANAISIKSRAGVDQIKQQIEAALQRQAAADAKNIKVRANGGRVTLSGHTSSWQSRFDAEGAAWAAPGVTEVVDDVMVETTF